MVASIAAILVNLIFNWLLIFGNLGFPALGVRGAAIATVLSRFVELAILIVTTHTRRFPFIVGALKSLYVAPDLVRRVAIKGLPLLLNEFLWSSGMAAIMACYSSRGINAVAACNIASTVNNLFNVVFLSMGNAVAIMVGQALGCGESDRAMDLSWKLMSMSVLSSLFLGGIMLMLAPFIPAIYNTEADVRATATGMLQVLAVMMPIFSIPHCCYFTLRAGGRTMITFLFDSVFTWGVSCLCAFCLSRFTTLPIVTMYALVQSMEIIKGAIGVCLVKKGIWIQNMVEPKKAD